MSEILETEITQAEPQVNDDSKNNLESVSPDHLHFKLSAFEGPLDLLLHLIKESKIDIYDIPIVEITQQYIHYLEMMKDLNLEIAGEFLVMAATLIHIKSRMLLPPDEKQKPEAAEDPRSELIKRLLEYQAYKESSLYLKKQEETWKNIFQRTAPDKDEFELEPEPLLFEASVFDLMTAFKKLLEKAPAQVVEITRETLTVADKINFIIERLEKEDSIRFEELFEEGFSRVTLIVVFLALLELIRLGLVKAYQENAFGAIWIINPQKQSEACSVETAQEVSP